MYTFGNLFASGNKDVITVNNPADGHGGGDFALMQDFVRLVQGEGMGQGLTTAATSVQSHLMSFAAEKSRLEKRIIQMDEYFAELKAKAQ